MTTSRSKRRLTEIGRQFWCDRSGSVAVIGACLLIVAVGLAAIVTDWGRMYVTKRDQQGVTDLAALVAARNLDRANDAATAVIAGNGIVPTQAADVVTGHYTPDRTQPVIGRFVPNGIPVNAVRVRVPAEMPLLLGRIISKDTNIPVVTEATAVTSELAAFSIGSRLASLNGGILNGLLGQMLGGNLSLSAMDYRALADARVSLFPFLDQLATQADLTAGTYNDVAQGNVSVGNVLAAMGGAGLSGPSPAAAEAALTYLGHNTDASHLTIPAGKLLDLGPYGALTAGEGAGLDASLRALDLVNAAAAIANEDRQIELDFGSSVPGLLDLSARLVVGERPQHSSWASVGEEGSSVYTAQTRVRLEATVGGSGVLSGVQIRVPILADIAWGQADLSSIICGDNPSSDALVGLDVLPGVSDLWIGEPSSGWTDFSHPPTVGPANLVHLPLINVNAAGHLSVSNVQETPVTFDATEIANHEIETVSTTTPVTSAINSLLANTQLDAQVLGLGIGAGAVQSLVAALIAPIGPAVDPLLMSLLDALGVHIGEADTAVDGVRCDGSVLVN